MTPDEVARQLDGLLVPGAAALGEYLARMERALPDRDGGACRRVYEAVRGIRQRHVAGICRGRRCRHDAADAPRIEALRRGAARRPR